MSLQRLEAPAARPLWLRWPQTVRAAFSVPTLSRRLIVLDLAERVFVASVFGHFAYRTLTSYAITANVLTLLLFIAEALPFIFVLLRAPSASLSQRPLDWGLGMLGTTAPLLVIPGGVAPLAPAAFCFALLLSGIMLQVAAKLVLGRAFGIVAANRGVRMLGPYRLVRHPMYAGYTLSHIGFLLANPTLSNAAIYACALALQLARILREENVLMRDAEYRAFAARVRFRLLPGVF
jgi:protein-S-isoprenylcysteine O-methyltransferase Ste14